MLLIVLLLLCVCSVVVLLLLRCCVVLCTCMAQSVLCIRIIPKYDFSHSSAAS